MSWLYAMSCVVGCCSYMYSDERVGAGIWWMVSGKNTYLASDSFFVACAWLDAFVYC